MSGYREWQTGEVVTAANVNTYLQDQTVMKFADAAARDTALGTAVGGGNALREGMVAYLDDTDAVQFYDGTAWGDVGSDPNAGIGSNVVQTVKTDTFTASLGEAAKTPITGLSASITPSSSSSLILVMMTVSASSTAWPILTLKRGSTEIFIGDADGSRSRSTVGGGGTGLADHGESIGFVGLDTPGTTSSTTYTVEISHEASSTQSVYVNRGVSDLNTSRTARTASSLTLIEVAA